MKHKIYGIVVEKGKKEPDKYHFGFGLSLRAWTAGGLIDYLKEIPKDAVLVDMKWREEFKDGRFYFEK